MIAIIPRLSGLLCALCIPLSLTLHAQRVDYSVVSVPEESGTNLMQITSGRDHVCMPMVRRSGEGVDWLSNRVIDVSKDGQSIAYLSWRGGTSNIFVKDLAQQGSSTQRTNRSSVVDFSYSPDGRYICFTEQRGQTCQVFRTDATGGYVCRQITSGNRDYSPVCSPDMKLIFFTRLENNGAGIWSYDTANQFLSSYTAGMNPAPVKGETAFVCSRQGAGGRGEIWKIDYGTGVEECLVSDPARSFTTPTVSPDGAWLLFVGSSRIATGTSGYWNTDLFVCRMDGTSFTQITYHAADDLSPVWSRDGRHIYFISQRGDANATANIWRIDFNYSLTH